MRFLAIDFETANYYRDSACAIGLALVENNMLVESVSYHIKPPSKWFVFTDLHGISWRDVKDQPTFAELWPMISKYFANLDFVVAHNASFDRGVLKACCKTNNIDMPDLKFNCTVDISRQVWKIYPTKLNIVCEHFGIPLDHHNALSDTLACAQIMVRAIEDGWNKK